MSSIKLIEGPRRELLKRHCRRIGVSIDVVMKLVEVEDDQAGRGKRHGLFKKEFEEIIGDVVDGESDVPTANSAA